VKTDTVVAPGQTPMECDGVVSWTLTAEPIGGRLKPGEAQIVVNAETHYYGGQGVGASGPIRLKGGGH